MDSTFLRFFFQFKSRCEIGHAFSGTAFITHTLLVLLFPVLHFPALEIWSFIFQSCWLVFDLFGP